MGNLLATQRVELKIVQPPRSSERRVALITSHSRKVKRSSYAILRRLQDQPLYGAGVRGVESLDMPYEKHRRQRSEETSCACQLGGLLAVALRSCGEIAFQLTK